MRDLHKVSEFTRRRKKRNQRRALLVCVAVLVALSTVYSLVLPAVTMEAQSASCGLDEHTHTSDCYTLTCGKEERFSHTHTDDCYTGGVLTCTLTEQTLHHHSNACYSQLEPTCGLTECEAHTHTEECYTDGTLTCTLAETAGHTHTSDCYPADFTAELICGQEDLPEHRHTDDCYTLTCELTGHTHTEECYSTAEAYALSLTEGAEEATEETEEETTEQASEEETEDTTEETTEQDSEETTEPATEEATEAATVETTGEATETTAEETTEAPTGETDLYTQLMSAASCEELDELFMANETASYALTADQLSAVQVYAQTLPDDGYLADVQDTLDALTEILEACTCGATDGRHTEDCPAYELISGEAMDVAGSSSTYGKSLEQNNHQYNAVISRPVIYDADNNVFKTTFSAKFTFTDKSVFEEEGYMWYYTLPDDFVPVSTLLGNTYKFYDDNNVYAGTYQFVEVTEQGKTKYRIVFTFDEDYVASTSGTISGEYSFNAQISADKYKNKEITIKKNGNTVFEIPETDINWKDGKSINYDVSAAKEKVSVSSDTLSYKATVSSTKGTPELTLTDTITVADGSSMSINSLDKVTVVKSNGDEISMEKVSSESELTSTSTKGTYYYDSTTGKTVYKLPALGANQSYTVNYTYSCSGVPEGATASATNSITATGSDSDKGETVTKTSDKVTVTVDRNMTMTKKGDYSSSTKLATWTITLNDNGESLNGYTLTDEMLGKATSTPTVTPNANYSFTYADDGTTITGIKFINNTTSSYQITYTTAVSDSTWSGTSIQNKATLTNPDGEVAKEITGSAYVGGSGVSKSVGEATVDSSAQTATIPWTITITPNGTTLTSGTTLLDSLSGGKQYFTREQILTWGGNITLYNGDSNLGTISPYTASTQYNTDMEITFTGTSADGTSATYTFTEINNNTVGNMDNMTFTDLSIKLTKAFDTSNITSMVLTYSTTADLSEAGSGTTTYSNTATVNGTSATASYNYYQLGVKKTDSSGNTGSSNVTSTGELVWYVEVTVDNGGYPSFTVEDTLPEGVTLKDLTIRGGEYGTWGYLKYDSSTGVISGSYNSEYTYSGSYDSNTGKIELTITASDGTVDPGVLYLTVTCTVTDENITELSAKNSVSVTGGGVNFGSDTQTQNWTKKEEDAGKDTTSKVSLSSTDEQRIYYELTLNPDAEVLSSDGDTITLTDVLQFETHRNQYLWLDMELEAGSVKLYQYKDDGSLEQVTNWSWTLQESSAAWGKADDGTENTMKYYTITATVPDGVKLLLKYSYKVDYTYTGPEDSNKQYYSQLFSLKNSATLEGGNTYTDQTQSDKQWEAADSSASIRSGYSFYKVDKDNYGNVLKGAEFTLYKWNGTKYVSDGTFTTGEDGLIQIFWQRVNNTEDHEYAYNTSYYLIETKAPDGYILNNPTKYYFYFSNSDTTTYPESYASDFPSTAKDLAKGGTAEYVENIERNAYTMTKTDSADGTLLDGAEFTLFEYTTDGWRETTKVYTTGESEVGKFVVQWQNSSTDYQFKANTAYYLKETKAPTGYDLPSTETLFYFWFHDTSNTSTTVPGYGFDTETATDLFKASADVSASNAKQKTYTITKVDASSYAADPNNPTKLSGAVFTLYKYVTNEGWVDTGTFYETLEDGTISIHWQNDDSDYQFAEKTGYYLIETKAPDGYKKDSSEKLYFCFGAPDWAQDWPSAGGYVDLSSDSGTATVSNSKTSITVNKTWLDSSGNKITDTSSMPGVSFTLYQKVEEATTSTETVTVNYSIYPDYSGSAPTTNTLTGKVNDTLTVTASGSGDFWLKLENPSGTELSKLNTTSYSMQLDTSGSYTLTIYNNGNAGTITPSFGSGSSSSTSHGTGGNIYTDGNGTGVYTLPTDDGSWSLTISDLPVGYTDSNGDYHAYNYYVIENPVAGYDTSYTNDEGTDGTGEPITIINTGNGSTSTYTTITVNKVWQDANNATTTALADSVTFEVYQITNGTGTGTLIDTVTLSASNNWTWSSSGLVKSTTDTSGNTTNYTYYVKEVVPDGATYTASYLVTGESSSTSGQSSTMSNGGTVTITNTSTVKTTTLKVSKTWAYDVVPDNVTELSFTLYKMTYDNDPSGTGATLEATDTLLGSGYDSIRSVVNTYKITKHTDGTWYWSSTEENLPLYSYENGKYYTYFIVETSSDAYTTTYSPKTEVIGGSTASDITVTNTVKTETTTISVNKTWSGTATTNSVNFKLFQKEWSTKPETTDLQAHSDVAYTDTTYPTEITLVTTGTLTASGEWKWDSSTDYTDTLYSYKDGKYYTYFIVEETSSSYTASYGKEVTSGTITVTNTPNTATTSLTVTKTWVGEELAESIKFKLYKVNLGTDSTATHKYSDGYQFDSTLPSDVTFVQEYTITKTDGTWPTTTIDDLTSFDGTNYYYYIVVEELDSSSTYSATYTRNGNAVTITNKANDTYTSLSVEKKWLDKDGNETTAPTGVDSITFTLYKRAVTTTSGAAGTPVITSENIIITKNADGTWPTWSSSTLDLKKTNSDGSITTYTYYIEEVTTGDFTTTYDRNDTTDGVSDGTITIKNTVNETTTLTVNKEWVGTTTETSLTFTLWQKEWASEPTEVGATKPDDATQVQVNGSNYSFTISRNTTTGEWSKWSSANDTNLTLYSYRNGKYYTYYVVEDTTNANFTAEYSRSGDTITVKNTVGAENTKLTVTKSWAGIGVPDDLESITFKIFKVDWGTTQPTSDAIETKGYKDGSTTVNYDGTNLPDGVTVYDTVTISNTVTDWPNWTWTSGDLVSFSGTNYYTYFIVEESNDKYTAAYSRTTATTGDTITVTNTTKDTTTELSVEKKWLVSDGTTDITLTSGSISFYLKQVAVTTTNGVSGEPVESNVKNGELEYFTITPDSNGSWTWNSNTAGLTLDLKKANSDGSVTSYSYYIVECEATTGSIPSYDLSNTTYTDSSGKTVSSTATVTSGTVTITNTLKPIETELSVTKTWAGVGELVDVTSVTFTLYQKTWDTAPTNVGTDIPEGATKVTKDDGTDYTIIIPKDTTTNTWPMWSSTSDKSLKLYSYKDGLYYTYYVVENTSSGTFTATYGRSTGASGDAITVTNTTTEKNTTLKVQKKWYDSDNKEITSDRTGTVYFYIWQTATTTAEDGTQNVGTETKVENTTPIPESDKNLYQLTSTDAANFWSWSGTLPLEKYDTDTKVKTTYSYRVEEYVAEGETLDFSITYEDGEASTGTVTKVIKNTLNPAEYTLPMTGGSGTTPFYILGSALTLGAFLLLNKKRYPRAKGR